MKTPGQVCYETYLEAFSPILAEALGKEIPSAPWGLMKDHVREIWEVVARKTHAYQIEYLAAQLGIVPGEDAAGAMDGVPAGDSFALAVNRELSTITLMIKDMKKNPAYLLSLSPIGAHELVEGLLMNVAILHGDKVDAILAEGVVSTAFTVSVKDDHVAIFGGVQEEGLKSAIILPRDGVNALIGALQKTLAEMDEEAGSSGKVVH